MTHGNATNRLPYKWRLLAYLFVAFFLEQSTRQVYSAALPQIRIDFQSYGVTDTQLGLVGTVFGMVFGLSIFGSGLAADLLGRKRVLVFGTLLFSAAVLGTGFAAGLGAMIVCYGVLNAIGQCCIAPPCYSLISQHHDNATRSTAMGIFQSAVYLGVILGSVFAGSLAQMGSGGWRWAFWALGGVGVVWALVMQRRIENTPHPGPAEDRATAREAFLALLKKPTAILIALAFGMFIYTNFGIRNWMTDYIVRAFGVTTAEAAFHGVFWYFVGALVGMLATARLMERFGRNRPRIRLEVSALGFLLCVGPMAWVANTGTLAQCCVALAVLGAAAGVYEAAHYPAMFDCIVPRYRSATTGLTGGMAFLMGSAAPVCIGWMNEHMSPRMAMTSLSAFFLAGALILLPAIFFTFRKDYVGE